ncbi:MAG: ACP phosphodiesterase [Pseudomonadota bacterium]
MNFLAHFHLAWPDPGLVAGALEGDYRKGPLPAGDEDGITDGVRLHRAIDAHTDSHPLVSSLREDFPPRLRRYAGILIDLSFDHFLTLHWQRYSDLELSDFAAGVYQQLAVKQSALSPAARRTAGWLEELDVLTRYDQWGSVAASAERLGQRFKRGNPLVGIGADLEPHAAQLEEAFLAFYPGLQSFAGRWRFTYSSQSAS